MICPRAGITRPAGKPKPVDQRGPAARGDDHVLGAELAAIVEHDTHGAPVLKRDASHERAALKAHAAREGRDVQRAQQRSGLHARIGREAHAAREALARARARARPARALRVARRASRRLLCHALSRVELRDRRRARSRRAAHRTRGSRRRCRVSCAERRRRTSRSARGWPGTARSSAPARALRPARPGSPRPRWTPPRRARCARAPDIATPWRASSQAALVPMMPPPMIRTSIGAERLAAFLRGMAAGRAGPRSAHLLRQLRQTDHD